MSIYPPREEKRAIATAAILAAVTLGVIAIMFGGSINSGNVPKNSNSVANAARTEMVHQDLGLNGMQ